MVLHPTVVSTLRTLRGVPTGNDLIDPLIAAPASIHGVKLAPSASTAANTVLVVGRPAATFFTRGPITSELGTNATDWITNCRTARFEQRCVLALQRPSMPWRTALGSSPSRPSRAREGRLPSGKDHYHRVPRPPLGRGRGAPTWGPTRQLAYDLVHLPQPYASKPRSDGAISTMVALLPLAMIDEIWSPEKFETRAE